MNEKHELQQELFEEFTQQAKARKRLFRPDYVRKTYTITFTNEQLIFAFIGVIILLVICFSLGVERGKRIIVAKESSAMAKEVQPQEQMVIKTKIQPAIKSEEATEKAAALEKIASPYAIQVASVKDSKEAEEEKIFLQKKGYKIEVDKTDKYCVVYVVGFADKKEADAVAIKLKDRYRDCFVKKRK